MFGDNFGFINFINFKTSSALSQHFIFLNKLKYVINTDGDLLKPDVQWIYTFNFNEFTILFKCYAAMKRFDSNSYSLLSETGKFIIFMFLLWYHCIILLYFTPLCL